MVMLRKGYYLSRGGHQVCLFQDLTRDGEIAGVKGQGLVAYLTDGTFAFKHDEVYGPHPGDSLDIRPETWQSVPYIQREEGKE